MIRRVSYIVLSIALAGSLVPVLLGARFGPTVLRQVGFNEAEGLGQLSPAVFHSLSFHLYPHVSDRRPGWFWGRTPAKPGEYIVAFDARHIVAAKADPSYLDLVRWFVLPTWVLPVVLCVAGVLVFVSGRLRRWLVVPAGHCRTCGYNLTGNVSGVCPECGEAV